MAKLSFVKQRNYLLAFPRKSDVSILLDVNDFRLDELENIMSYELSKYAFKVSSMYCYVYPLDLFDLIRRDRKKLSGERSYRERMLSRKNNVCPNARGFI